MINICFAQITHLERTSGCSYMHSLIARLLNQLPKRDKHLYALIIKGVLCILVQIQDKLFQHHSIAAQKTSTDSGYILLGTYIIHSYISIHGFICTWSFLCNEVVCTCMLSIHEWTCEVFSGLKSSKAMAGIHVKMS